MTSSRGGAGRPADFSGWGVCVAWLVACLALFALGAELASAQAPAAATAPDPLEPAAAPAPSEAPATASSGAEQPPGPRAAEFDPAVLALEPKPAPRSRAERLAALESGDPVVVPRSAFMPQLRQHYYSVLYRSPLKAFLWELLPGAGHIYAGFTFQAIVSAGLTLAGAGLWIAGAVKHDDAFWWSGVTTFSIGRVYGLISAPVSAMLLNNAYRRQFGLVTF